MNYLDYLKEFEATKEHRNKHGRKIASLSGVRYVTYTNAINGRVRNLKILKKVYDGINSFISLDTV